MLFCGQHRQRAAQIFTNGAADASVVHLNDLFLAIGHQDVVVDVFLTELVFDDGNFLTVRFAEHALEQRGFSGTKKAGEDGDGDECYVA